MEAIIDRESVEKSDRYNKDVIGKKMPKPDPNKQSSGSDANPDTPPKRGRPKGARTTTLAEARRQAAEEKASMKREFSKINGALQSELTALREKYDEDMAQLHDELDVYRRREANYRLALGERLNEVADYLQNTLVKWGEAELEEAVIDKRGRGRPRKTLK